MPVVVQTQSWRALALIKYFNIVQKAYSSFLGSVELKYAEMVHMQAYLYPTLPWDGKATELWTELVVQDQPAIVQCDTSHLLFVAEPKALEAKLPMAKEPPMQHYWEYKGGGQVFSFPL